MKRVFRIAVGGCAVALLALSAISPADAKCTRASATGVGLGPEMAKEMAKMNLDAGLSAKGQKAKGKTVYKCSMPIMSECTATVRAC